MKLSPVDFYMPDLNLTQLRNTQMSMLSCATSTPGPSPNSVLVVSSTVTRCSLIELNCGPAFLRSWLHCPSVINS